MTQEQFDFLYNQAKDLMNRTRDANHDWMHIERVLDNAFKIKQLLFDEQQNEIDDKILKLACVWHDTSYAFYKAGVSQYFLEGWRCLKISRRYFQKANLDSQEINLLSSVIFWHPFVDFLIKSRRKSLYHQIIQDADWLDGLHPIRVGKAEELAKDSWYWRFVIKIIKPLFFNFQLNNKRYYLNLPESLKIKK